MYNKDVGATKKHPLSGQFRGVPFGCAIDSIPNFTKPGKCQSFTICVLTHPIYSTKSSQKKQPVPATKKTRYLNIWFFYGANAFNGYNSGRL